MFRFKEAEEKTMQSGIKKAYYSHRIFTSSPSDCSLTTVSSSFFYLSNRITTGSPVCDIYSELYVLKWLMPVVMPTRTFQKHLQV